MALVRLDKRWEIIVVECETPRQVTEVLARAADRFVIERAEVVTSIPRTRPERPVVVKKFREAKV